MSDIAVRVENLGKCYQIGQAKSGDFRQSFGGWMDKLRGRSNGEVAESKEFWALKDINFEIKKGEAVGIIGRNGAGKSTLLKILSRITEPTRGRFEINGRVSSLLEVGTGFHPELSGRENIFLNGTILGMKRKEIKAKLDEIIAFSGVERFIDTPVKHYSSGMKVRLAFSVAAHLEPEILIIDEVLAVGDAEFQKKCLGKMDEVSKNEGRTVIFVSHNMTAVQGLCEKGILLRMGGVDEFGSMPTVISNYLKKESKATSYFSKGEGRVNYIEYINLETSSGQSVTEFMMPLKLELRLRIKESLKNAALSFQIKDINGRNILHNLVLASELSFGRKDGVYTLVNEIKTLRLYPGNYTISFYLADAHTRNTFEILEEKIDFEVVRNGGIRDYFWKEGSAVYLEENNWKILVNA